MQEGGVGNVRAVELSVGSILQCPKLLLFCLKVFCCLLCVDSSSNQVEVSLTLTGDPPALISDIDGEY